MVTVVIKPLYGTAGYTLEDLNTIYASLDSIPTSLDSPIWSIRRSSILVTITITPIGAVGGLGGVLAYGDKTITVAPQDALGSLGSAIGVVSMPVMGEVAVGALNGVALWLDVPVVGFDASGTTQAIANLIITITTLNAFSNIHSPWIPNSYGNDNWVDNTYNNDLWVVNY